MIQIILKISLLLFLSWLGTPNPKVVSDHAALRSLSFSNARINSSYESVQEDIIQGNRLPKWGWICAEKINVYGSPRETASIQYVMYRGHVVRLYGLSKADSSWVMIQPANWISMSNVCFMENNP